MRLSVALRAGRQGGSRIRYAPHHHDRMMFVASLLGLPLPQRSEDGVRHLFMLLVALNLMLAWHLLDAAALPMCMAEGL